ncbi:MAG: cell wall hydrolase [Rhodospirillaceae bacterium]|nr:cell wall hydrolase [Rhodospirillaceae bacterium]
MITLRLPRLISVLRQWTVSGFLAVAAMTVSLAVAAPVAGAVEIPSDMKIDLSSIVVSKDELVCLALNDYWEARSESLAGRIAVARVVLNRAMDSRFPGNLCDIIKQTTWQGENKRCQFSWYCEGKSDAMAEPDQWRLSLKIAAAVLQKDCAIPDPTGGALWYHADFTRPAWAVGYESTTIIGNHVFYRDFDNSKARAPARRPFIYRLNAFAEAVQAKTHPTNYANAGDATKVASTVGVQGGPAPVQPLAR